MTETVSYSGTIQKVTPDGQSAFVRLNTAVHGVSIAVIGSSTTGRSTVSVGGQIRQGTHVVGLARRGSDALKAVTVSVDTNSQ
jgi:hypothetical protein